MSDRAFNMILGMVVFVLVAGAGWMDRRNHGLELRRVEALEAIAARGEGFDYERAHHLSRRVVDDLQATNLELERQLLVCEGER